MGVRLRTLARAEGGASLRTWVTGSGYDLGPMDWIFGLRNAADAEPIRSALQAGEREDAAIATCLTALLAAECVAYLRDAPANLHFEAHAWCDSVGRRVPGSSHPDSGVAAFRERDAESGGEM